MPYPAILYQPPVSGDARADSRIGLDLILTWRTKEVRHADWAGTDCGGAVSCGLKTLLWTAGLHKSGHSPAAWRTGQFDLTRSPDLSGGCARASKAVETATDSFLPRVCMGPSARAVSCLRGGRDEANEQMPPRRARGVLAWRIACPECAASFSHISRRSARSPLLTKLSSPTRPRIDHDGGRARKSGASARCSASNRPDPPSASCRFTPPSKTPSKLLTRKRGVKKRSRTRPTWFSTWPFSQLDAGVQATGSTRWCEHILPVWKNYLIPSRAAWNLGFGAKLDPLQCIEDASLVGSQPAPIGTPPSLAFSLLLQVLDGILEGVRLVLNTPSWLSGVCGKQTQPARPRARWRTDARAASRGLRFVRMPAEQKGSFRGTPL